MACGFLKPVLSQGQKTRLKILCKRDDYHGFVSIVEDACVIFLAVLAPITLTIWAVPLSIILIGSRQRALASLLHEAAHGILFKSRFLNHTIGRFVCGWPILQSFDTYKASHVLSHHPKIGDAVFDPDLSFMISQGVYKEQTRSQFIYSYVVAPLLGSRILPYIWYVVRHRFIDNVLDHKNRMETLCLIVFHFCVVLASVYLDFFWWVLLLWYVPLITSFAVIGWFSELSEHFPMMGSAMFQRVYPSRNRYAAWWERVVIGMHGDNFHLTHHLFPAVPHWNLGLATAILREDPGFREWDDLWGGIFSGSGLEKCSLVNYIFDAHPFQGRSMRSVVCPICL